MALNPFLHPRNPYRKRPDFKDLALKYPEFRSIVKTDLTGKISIDFSSRDANRIFTKTCLKNDFDLEIDIPEGHLVPTLPLRFNYLLWLEDMLEENKICTTSENICGLDIGVGSSCIYPILAKKKFGWNMVGTEVDELNYKKACENVSANHLENSICIIESSNSNSFFHDEIFNYFPGGKIHFSMCNPPFYDAHDKSDPTNGASDEPAGKSTEIMTEGGETEYFKKMLNDSAVIGEKIPFFTCLLGHKSSMKKAKAILHTNKELPVKSYSSTEFCQGRTMRWGIAWTFRANIDLESVKSLYQIQKNEKKEHKPVKFDFKKCTTKGDDFGDCSKAFLKISGWLEDIDVTVKSAKMDAEFVSFTAKTTERGWKNQRRKRREKARAEQQEDEPPPGKRQRVDENENQGKQESSRPTEEVQEKKAVQLCVKFCLSYSPEGIYGEATLINGEAGKEGVAQVIQYLKNKANGH